MKTRFLYAFFGLLATAAGMTAGYLVAQFFNPDSSPLFAVGDVIVRHTPADVQEWAIGRLGSNDKTVLQYSVIAVVLVVVAAVMFVVGGLRRLRAPIGTAVLVVIVAVAAVAALTRPTVDGVDVLPAIATAIVGVGAFLLLDRSLGQRGSAPSAEAVPQSGSESGQRAKPRVILGADGASTEVEHGEPVGAGAARDVERPGAKRRTVVLVSAGVAVLAAAMTGAGRVVGNLKAKPENLALPEPASPAAAIPAGLDKLVPGITPLQISNADFYRVDTRLDVPVIDSGSWTLTVDGDVKNELSISFADLLAMDLIERDITFTCVSNSVGGTYVGGARWLGVPLKTILDMAGVGDTADQILSTDFDGMTISTPLDVATDGRDAMIAVGMNGVQLPRAHGFPARMIVPGLYGFVSGTKWVTKLTLTTYAAQQSYWTKKKWDTDAPIKPSSRIDTPRALSQFKAGETIIGGVAWAQADSGVKKVQVQIDGGAWRDTINGPDVNNVYWRQWYYKWQAEKGSHTLNVRCIDGDGDAQTAARTASFPGGSSGIQSLVVTAI